MGERAEEEFRTTSSAKYSAIETELAECVDGKPYCVQSSEGEGQPGARDGSVARWRQARRAG